MGERAVTRDDLYGWLNCNAPGDFNKLHDHGGADPWDLEASRRDRGYDFQAATRWFAERSDVVLLFFDPDKPGTTGETLQCLTSSLRGTMRFRIPSTAVLWRSMQRPSLAAPIGLSRRTCQRARSNGSHWTC